MRGPKLQYIVVSPSSANENVPEYKTVNVEASCPRTVYKTGFLLAGYFGTKLSSVGKTGAISLVSVRDTTYVPRFT